MINCAEAEVGDLCTGNLGTSSTSTYRGVLSEFEVQSDFQGCYAKVPVLSLHSQKNPDQSNTRNPEALRSDFSLPRALLELNCQYTKPE